MSAWNHDAQIAAQLHTSSTHWKIQVERQIQCGILKYYNSIEGAVIENNSIEGNGTENNNGAYNMSEGVYNEAYYIKNNLNMSEEDFSEAYYSQVRYDRRIKMASSSSSTTSSTTTTDTIATPSIVDTSRCTTRSNIQVTVDTESMTCPINRDIMVDPVIIQDGHTYERAAIMTWFTKSNKSPLTRAVITDTKNLIPNLFLKGIIDQYNNTKK